MDLLNSPSFASHVEDLMRTRHVPGLAIAVVQDDKTASKGFGYASVEAKTKCTADTIFDIASASKSIAAASVALLVDDEEYHPQIKWNAKMSELLPGDFVLPDQSFTDNVTVDDMISHRTGIPSHDLTYRGPQAGENADTPRSVVRSFRDLPLAAPLRTKYMYNNMMFTTATYLVEVHSDQLFPDFAEEKFFKPLGMNSTNIQPARARAKGLGDRIARGHVWQRESERHHEFDTPDCPEAQGAGSIMTSANDYILWVKAMMNKEAPLNEQIYDNLVRSRSLPEPDLKDLRPLHSSTIYAAGLETFFYRSHLVVKHDGGVPGFATCHFFLPDSKFGGVVFANLSGGGMLQDLIVLELIDAALGIPQAERLDWTTIIKDLDDSDLIEQLEKERQKLCPGIKDSEPQLKPLSAYVGEYTNQGYHTFKVEERNGKLFVDASDRSMGFTLHFDHVCSQTKYIAHQRDCLDLEGYPMRAEFQFSGDKATRMAIDFEPDLEDYIWFDRVQ